MTLSTVLKLLPQGPTVVSLLLSMPLPLSAQSSLDGLSLEQLMTVEVTSASDRRIILDKTAAASFVISAEDIRRSGVTSVAEALRMVPGIHVARIDDTRWAVTARGFNDQFANKMSVSIDGRHVNSPSLFGTFWDEHMPLIDNVERIEVIRGPGDAFQGLNAVNGSINIVSRTARDTQGLLVQGRMGSPDLNGITARYGSVTDSGWYYRFDYHSVDENVTDSPIDRNNFDNLSQQKISFRIDSPKMNGLSSIYEGAYHRSDSKEVVRALSLREDIPELGIYKGRVNGRGFWFKGDWLLELASGDAIEATAYWEDTERDYSLGELAQRTLSFDVAGEVTISKSNKLRWGFETYFATLPLAERAGVLSLPSNNTNYDLYRVQLQDEVVLTDTTSLSVGLRVEKNQFIDWDFQPNIRISWQRTEDLLFWMSASSATRMPSFGEKEYRITPVLLLPEFSELNPGPLPITANWRAAENFNTENLIAFEMGLKQKLGQGLSVDLAVFQHNYDDVQSGQLAGIQCKPERVDVSANPSCILNNNYLNIFTEITTELDATTRGAELSLNWHAKEDWQLSGALTLFDYDFESLELDPGDVDFSELFFGIGSASEPEWIAYLRSAWSINDRLDLDVSYRAVGNSDVFTIDSYDTFDVRLEWRPSSSLRFELIGQNMVDSGHYEFGVRTLDAMPSQVDRSVFIRLSWAP